MAAKIDPVMALLECCQCRDLDGSVADNIQQRLVAPDIAFERRDIEIADDDGRFAQIRRPTGHAIDKRQLLREFGVDQRVGHIATGGHIDIFDEHAGGQARTDMAGLAIVLPVVPTILDQRHPRQRGNAMMHLLAVEQAVAIPQRFEHVVREGVVDDLGFLQAQHIGGMIAQEAFDDIEPETDRIDVPGGNAQRHHARVGEDARCVTGRGRKSCLGASVDHYG